MEKIYIIVFIIMVSVTIYPLIKNKILNENYRDEVYKKVSGSYVFPELEKKEICKDKIFNYINEINLDRRDIDFTSKLIVDKIDIILYGVGDNDEKRKAQLRRKNMIFKNSMSFYFVDKSEYRKIDCILNELSSYMEMYNEIIHKIDYSKKGLEKLHRFSDNDMNIRSKLKDLEYKVNTIWKEISLDRDQRLMWEKAFENAREGRYH